MPLNTDSIEVSGYPKSGQFFYELERSMSYKCDKCEALILSLRLGYCSNCREPIHIETLPKSKQQALAADEREYEAMRDRVRAEKDIQQGVAGVRSIHIGISAGDGWDG